MGKLSWIALLYFAEGFPFGLLNETLPVYFRFQGISLQEIGLLSLIGLAWTLKFLWAPAVDLLWERKVWISGCQFFLGAGMLALALLPGIEKPNLFFWNLLLVMAFFSATQDIAIDAYTIEFLEPKEMGEANGIRVTFYRVALIVAGGLLVAGAGLFGWPAMLLTSASLMFCSALLTMRVPHLSLPRPATAHPLAEAIRTPLKQFWDRPHFVAVMSFILLFKIGDYALAPMTKTFWVDRHFTPLQIGLVPGTVGVASTVLGALIGGRLTSRWGIFKALWILGLFQAISNLVYVLAAGMAPSNLMMYMAAIAEAFCAGLGTTSFLSFLMSICDKRHAATQYALLSALFGLSRSLAGAFSGYGAQRFGYAPYFALTFLLALPAFALLAFVRRWIPQNRID